ncbi:RDD family protein [Nodosilinea sp. LEGE 06152]|uniref:RDD family protein n=1 Tax=Nodosilinea sp. LEGE 06152 TaxID=2777966 RepID=UPI00187E244C|nr:RDD family protein [Nodosilinea sp. LEGE 06152]MBE9156838.1 RDD family protein [Nodosilinea sp. LEGE 06152]
MPLFNTITIRTPESVELEFVLAGVGSRAVALTLDYLCLGAGLVGLTLVYSFLLVRLLAVDTVLSIPSETVQLWVTAIAAVLAFFLYIGYFALFETWWYGQTPGKRCAKIRVIRDDGQPERLPQATLRSLLRPIDDILFIGFFCILLSKTEKRVGDWLAGTLVVQTDPVTNSQIRVPERSQAIGKDLLALVEITRLSPDDFATVREFLQRRQAMSPKAKTLVSDQLARRFRGQLGLETLPTEMTTDTFLEAIYFAYQEGN